MTTNSIFDDRTAPPDIKTPGSTWVPRGTGGTVDKVMAGEVTYPKPTVGRMADGSYVLYPARINGCAGESGAGKSWTALYLVATELEAGNTAVFVDFEDDEAGLVTRLIAMGTDPKIVAAGFLYLQPEETMAGPGRDLFDRALDVIKPSIVVIDSTGEAMANENCDPNSDEAVTSWAKQTVQWVAKKGPAVLLLDHMPKTDVKALTPIGSQRKRAIITGVQLTQSMANNKTFKQGQAGQAEIRVGKDRSGVHLKGSVIARLVVHPVPDRMGGAGCEIKLIPGAEAWGPTIHMEAISKFLEAQPTTEFSTNAITNVVTGKKATLIEALKVLELNGCVETSHGDRGATLYMFVKPFAIGDEFKPLDGEELSPDSSPTNGPACTEHEWHAKTTCSPEWCHQGHYGSCNR